MSELWKSRLYSKYWEQRGVEWLKNVQVLLMVSKCEGPSVCNTHMYIPAYWGKLNPSVN